MSKFATFDRSHRCWPTKVIGTTENPDAWGERQWVPRSLSCNHDCPPKEQPPPETLRYLGPCIGKTLESRCLEHLTEGATLSGSRTEGGNTFN